MTIRSDTAGSEKDYLRDMLPPIVGRVLEIGCGDGRLTRKYADLAERVIGIDLPASLPGVDSPPLPPALDIAAASGVRLPFAARRFDQVIFALSF